MIWHPYTQHKTAPNPLHVTHATGVTLHLKTGETLIDTISSWWSVIHGYNHPRLNNALKTQIDQLSHVMLGGLTHDPAEKLAQTLVQITPPGLNHVFFSDSGSVGVEVALKIALQFWKNQGLSTKSQFIALQFAYHGDTTGAMSVSDPIDSMHHLFADSLPQHHFIPSPTLSLDHSLTALETRLKSHHHQTAALIVEPLVQGAGGLKFYDPEFLVQARQLCTHYNVLLIADEIATGFGRTGTRFAVNQAQLTPDIMILGKGLTGGYLGHAATLTTTQIFDAFYSDDPQKAFMHGPTFMGNPLACAVANESIAIFQDENYIEKIHHIETQLQDSLTQLQHPTIKETRVKGAIGVIELHTPVDPKFQVFAQKQGIWNRPFGNVIYVMPAYIITTQELNQTTTMLKAWFQSS